MTQETSHQTNILNCSGAVGETFAQSENIYEGKKFTRRIIKRASMNVDENGFGGVTITILVLVAIRWTLSMNSLP